MLFELFKTFLLLGAFSFGGGMASMELIRSYVVTDHQWLNNTEFTDIISIAEMTPGPLGINIASFVGTRIAGIPGTIVATFSYVAPAILIVVIMAKLYYKYRSLSIMQGVLHGLHPVIVAMVLSATIKLAKLAFFKDTISEVFPYLSVNYSAIPLVFLLLFLLQKKITGPITTILLSGCMGLVIYGIPMIYLK